MERKFKVGDRVKLRNSDTEGVVIDVSEHPDALFPYEVQFKDVFDESRLEPMSDEPKYKKGGKVWDLIAKKVAIFDRYAPSIGGVFIAYVDGGEVFRLPSNIEPYTGQDVYKEYEEKMKAMHKKFRDDMYREQIDFYKTFNAKHPFTIILKSGVKIGVDEQTAKGISLLGGETVHQIDGTHYFVKSVIAAIVPSGNVLS